MPKYTVHLFRSGRVFLLEGEHAKLTHDIDQPLVTEFIEANSEVAALGKVLLKYVDKANQPRQIVPVDLPCGEPCCTCVCGQSIQEHTPTMSPGHSFVPMSGKLRRDPTCKTRSCTSQYPCADCVEWSERQ